MRYFILVQIVFLFLSCGERVLFDDSVTSNSRLPAITQFSPINSYSSTNRRPLFYWASTENFTCTLILSTNKDFSTAITNVSFTSATSNSYTPDFDITTNSTVYWRVDAVFQDGQTSSQTYTIITPFPPIMLFTEWADAGSGVDFIELRNFGSSHFNLTSDFAILYNGNTVTVTSYGTGDDPAGYAAIGGGVAIAPDEIIIVVDSDVTLANIEQIRAWGLPAGTKVFVSTESTLLGTGDRLDETQASMTNQDGNAAWGITPFPFTGGTSTYSIFLNTYSHGTDSTTNNSFWTNGSSSDAGTRTPGVWP